MPTAEEAPQAMKARLQKAVDEGYHVLAVAEMRYEGEMPPIGFKAYLAEHPDHIHILTFLIEHEDHWHLYVLTLAKPDFDTHSHDLTDRLLTLFESLSMDERASVAAVGRA